MANKKGNQRAQRTDQAILAAAREIMVSEGMDAVTHQRVAEVAQVGRATVYRRWPSIDVLILAVFERLPFPFLDEDESGDFRERLRRNLAWTVSFYSSDATHPLPLALAERAQHDERMRAALDGLIGQKERNLAAAIQQASPEIRASLIVEDPKTLISILLGPLYYRSMLQGEEITAAFIDTIIDSIFVKSPA